MLITEPRDAKIGQPQAGPSGYVTRANHETYREVHLVRLIEERLLPRRHHAARHALHDVGRERRNLADRAQVAVHAQDRMVARA